jgi:PhnB protein
MHTQTITPYLLYEDVEAAIEWLAGAFAFREVDRTTGAAGGIHTELEIAADGTRIYAGSPPQGFRNPRKVGSTTLMYVLVDDVDAHHARAKEAGAEIVEELTDLPYGHRRYTCTDPEGHQWTFAAPIAGG